MQHRSFIVLLATVAGCTAAAAADLAPFRGATTERYVHQPPPQGVAVVIDDLLITHSGCRRDPDCIAPRILPVRMNDRRAVYAPVVVRVDPRFSDVYLPR